MKNLSKYPKALQLLMHTDGTVTELIKLLTSEDIKVIKLSEKFEDNNKILNRCIFLRGKKTDKDWLYAESKIYLNNLPEQFVNDLLNKILPIGTLWINFRMETFKQLISQSEELSTEATCPSLAINTKLLSRVYHVFNQRQIIMEISEKFPIHEFDKLNIL